MKEVNLKSLGYYFKPMAILALPIALQSCLSFFVNLADNVMIGKLGDLAVSSVYMGTQMFTLLQWFVAGITISMTILAAQYWGRKDTVSIKKIMGIGTVIGVPVCVLLSVLCVIYPGIFLRMFTNQTEVIEASKIYLRIMSVSFPFFCLSQIFIAALRSIENTKIGLYVSAVALIANVVLNALLIFGLFGLPKMGVAGAALATLISRFIELVFITAYMFTKEKILLVKIGELISFDTKMFKTFFHYGFPVFLGELVWGFKTVMNNSFMGRYSTEVIAAYSMINLLNETVFVWIIALESAAGILTGKMIGEGKKDEIRPYTYNMQLIFTIVGAIAVVVLLIVRHPLIALYDVSEVSKHCAFVLSNVGIPIVLFTSYQDMTLCGIIKCGGETSFVLKTDSFMIFIIMLPACLIAAKLSAPYWLVFFLLHIDQILKCFVAYTKANKFTWAHDLTTK